MAVIQYTGLVNQIRGKVNGSVLNKSRTVNTVQKKQQPPKGNRGFQSEIRQDFSYAQRRWKDLTSSQQNSWQVAASFNPARDRFGNQVILSGYNQYIKAFILARYSDSFVDNNAYPGAAPSAFFELYSLLTPAFYISESGGTAFSVYINDYDAPTVAGYGFIFDISLPVSSGVTSYHGRWVNVAGSGTVGGIVTALNQDLGVYYPMPVQGQRILWRARLVHIQTGAVVVAQDGVFTDWIYQPAIESFIVEPVTGVAPYVFRASFINKGSIDNVAYGLRFYYAQLEGACPIASAIVMSEQDVADSLLLTDSWVKPTDVLSGICFGGKLRVVRLADGATVQESVLYISNL